MRKAANERGGTVGGGVEPEGGRPRRFGLRLSARRRDGGAVRLHQVPPALPLRGAQPGPAALQGPGDGRQRGERLGLRVTELKAGGPLRERRVWGGRGEGKRGS